MRAFIMERYRLRPNHVLSIGGNLITLLIVYVTIATDNNFVMRFIIDDWNIPLAVIGFVGFGASWRLAERRSARWTMVYSVVHVVYTLSSIYALTIFGARGLFPAILSTEVLVFAMAFWVEQSHVDQLEQNDRKMATQLKDVRTQNELYIEQLKVLQSTVKQMGVDQRAGNYANTNAH